jgi:hypothetical protein
MRYHDAAAAPAAVSPSGTTGNVITGNSSGWEDYQTEESLMNMIVVFNVVRRVARRGG